MFVILFCTFLRIYLEHEHVDESFEGCSSQKFLTIFSKIPRKQRLQDRDKNG